MRPPQNAGGLAREVVTVDEALLASMRPPQNAGGIRQEQTEEMVAA